MLAGAVRDDLRAVLIGATVPSAPRPKNIACSSPSGGGGELRVPGQAGKAHVVVDPTMNDGGLLAARSSKTALAIPGVNSLEESP